MARASVGDGSGVNEDLIRETLKHRGTRYVWGGASRGGFDCSGFIRYIFARKRGIMLPHSASAQARMGQRVERGELQPGDVVFFATYRPSISHVGIYVGDNKFVHAANRRKGCRTDTLTGYYGSRYRGARRYCPTPLRLSPEDLSAASQDTSEEPTATQ
ncbi:MAG TPA: C40 family peptidase [Armatimonadota bacterium]|nr:C40 family peptidase [Armatimonadota bacterium]